MIETVLLEHLRDAVDVPVVMEVPEQMPERFVVLEKTGSSVRNHIFSATVAVQSWAPRMAEAAALNDAVKQALLYGDLPNEITRVSLNSDYNFTDPDEKKYRYQAVYDITHYNC